MTRVLRGLIRAALLNAATARRRAAGRPRAIFSSRRGQKRCAALRRAARSAVRSGRRVDTASACAPDLVVQLAGALVLLDRVAAVDHQQLAGDVAGVVAGQEEDGPGHLFRLRRAAHRRVEAADVLAVGLRAGGDPAGADGVDRHAVLGHVEGQAARHAEHAGLGGAVGRLLRVGDHGAGDRADVDDAAVAALDHAAARWSA